jgi:hypothetical protein
MSIATITCDICYEERQEDMMVRCCDRNDVRVCSCNVSICRRCADKMELRCPTCRKRCFKYTYIDEVKEKTKKLRGRLIKEPVIQTFTINQDVYFNPNDHQLDILNTRQFWMRKARIVALDEGKVMIQLYSCQTYTHQNDMFVNGVRAYEWNVIEPEIFVIEKNIHKLKFEYVCPFGSSGVVCG